MSDHKFYYILMEIDISSLEPSGLNEIIKYYNDGKLDIKIFSCVNMPILTIYLIKDFTPGDKVFTTLGNECIYKIFGNMHEFYIKDRIELPNTDSRNQQLASNSSSIPSIPNFYRNILLIMLNKINSIRNLNGSNFFSDKLDINDDLGVVEAVATAEAAEEAEEAEATAVVDTSIKKYYRIKKDGKIQMIPESELDANKEFIYYEGLQDKDKMGNQINETISILNPVLNNNNVFITISNNMIVIMNKWWEDEIKTVYIPPQKRQLKNFFKFITWVLSKEYVKKCLEIIKNSDNPLVKIDEILKNNTIFHITSLQNYNIEELNKHLKAHKQYVKNFFINEDPYLCKNYNPVITVHPYSDINSSILHFHIQQDIIHSLPLKTLNFKYEFLKSKESIYDFASNSYRIGKIINKSETNKDNIKICLLNPYVPAIKLSGIFIMIN